MTTVEQSKVRREVPSRGFGRLIITLAPEGIWLREKGRRTAYLASYGAVYQRAVLEAVAEAKRAKARERKARKLAKGGR